MHAGLLLTKVDTVGRWAVSRIEGGVIKLTTRWPVAALLYGRRARELVQGNQTTANRVFAATSQWAGKPQRANGSMTEFCQLDSMLSLSGCCGTNWDAIASGLDVSRGRGTEEGTEEGTGWQRRASLEGRCGAMGAQVSAAFKLISVAEQSHPKDLHFETCSYQ